MSSRLSPTVIRGNGSHGVGGRASELPIITIAVVQHAPCTCSVGVLQRLVGAADHGPQAASGVLCRPED